MTTHTTNIDKQWFLSIMSGDKKVEGRLNKGKFSKIEIGDFITFECNDEQETQSKITKEVKDIKNYKTFQNYLQNETLNRCLPGIDNMDDGLKIYYTYYTVDNENEYGVKAFIF